MTDTYAIVTPDEALSVAVSEGTITLTSSTAANPAIVESISDIANVNTSSLVNGSVLVYKTATNKWTSTILLDQQNVEAGEF